LRILIISTFFPPTSSIASLRPYCWAKYWSLDGHDVTVLTQPIETSPHASLDLPNTGFHVLEAEPSFHKFLKMFKGSYQATQKEPKENSSKNFIFSGLDTIRQKTGIFGSCRMPDLSELWVRPAFKQAAKQKPWDVIVSTCGPYTVHRVAAWLKQAGMGKRWLADYRDLWSDSQIFKGLVPFSWMEKRLERKLMSHADWITTVSAPLQSVLANKYGKDKVHLIENGTDPQDFQNLPLESCFSDPTKLHIVHTGTIYEEIYNPYPLFKAIKELVEDPETRSLVQPLEVHFVGKNGTHFPKIVQAMHLEKYIKFCAPIPRIEALRMQRDADYLLLLLWGDLDKEGIVTGKMFEFLYSMTPILAIGGTSKTQRLSFSNFDDLGHHFGCETKSVKNFLLNSLKKFSKGIRPERKPLNRELILLKFTRQALSSKILSIIAS
jgi:glycosyltransferase involved in cell wall biosynthesis